MVKFPKVVAPQKFEGFLKEIEDLKVPERANIAWLKSVGYTSSNDQAFLRVLQFIGFLDSSRKPTGKWELFRDKDTSRQVLADAIMKGYSALYFAGADTRRANVMIFHKAPPLWRTVLTMLVGGVGLIVRFLQ